MREYKHRDSYRRLTIWLTEDIYNNLQEASNKTKLNNNSEHVRRALVDYCKKINKAKNKAE